MNRWWLILAASVAALDAADCQAQLYGRWYRYGGYGGYYSGDGSTPNSNAVRSQAQLIVAQGMAAESYAEAAEVVRLQIATLASSATPILEPPQV